MSKPTDNPIVRVWREVQQEGGSLQDAVAAVREAEFVAGLTEDHINELHEALASGAGLHALPG